MRKKNLNCTWVDVAKAYDSVSQNWLKKVLEMHRIPLAIRNTIMKLSSQWKTKLKVKTQSGLKFAEPIQFKRGIYQGDTLCLLLFIMCVNPMAWKLRTLQGYKMTKPVNISISHSSFIDDLTLYSSSERQQAIKLALTHQMMEDTGLSMSAKKTKTISMARGKRVEKEGDLQLSQDVTIKDLGHNLYKFLGVEEAELQENKTVLKKAEKEVVRRVSVILDTPLSDYNKIQAINIFALPVLTYFMPVLFFSQDDLKEVDLKIKRLLTERGARHPQHLNTQLYARRSVGGRGLKELSTIYKETKIKTALRIESSKDPKLQAVARFQRVKESKGRRSIFKDAKRHARELILDLELGDEPVVSFTSTEERTHTATDVAGVKLVMGKAQTDRSELEIKGCKWQGNIVSNRLEDESIELSDCFSWSTSWKSAPTYTVCAVNEIYQQLSKTRVREEMIDRTCRKCHQHPETVEHILSGCPELAQRHYLWRHNAALKWVLSELLMIHSIRVKPLAFMEEPASFYSSDDVEIIWDCSITTDARAEGEVIDPTW